MNLLDEIKSREPLEQYIEKLTGMQFKQIGLWKTLSECPICGHKDCGRFSSDGKFYCFSCSAFAANAVQFRALYENTPWRDALEKFRAEMGIKKYEKREVDWTAIREAASEYLRETLFSCSTKYPLGGGSMTPIRYLLDIRKHGHEALLHFQVGFNDGRLIEHLKKSFSEEVITASGLSIVPEGCFTFPLMVEGDIKYFRVKDPNKVRKQQMPLSARSKDGIWYNQDSIKAGAEVVLCEGEHDVISFWEAGIEAAASCGSVSQDHISYLKKFELPAVYLAFDNDGGGKTDTDRIVKNYENTNVFIMQFPEGRDPDDMLRGEEDKATIVTQLKREATTPSPEMRSAIKQRPDGYYIEKFSRDGNAAERKITNWTGSLEAVIIDTMDARTRKVKIKKGPYETVIYFPSEVLASAQKLREFLFNSCNEVCMFQGTDQDLNCLIQYWSVAYNPKIVKESDCVGEIDEGFITDNVFIGNNNEFKPLTNTFLALDDLHSIKITPLVRRGGSRSEIPYFPLTEPAGGIDKFKENIFNLMLKNRNMKMAIGVGWIKSVLWSKAFYEQKRWFPLFMFHGKYAGGKTVAAMWLMSFLGLRDSNPEMISDRGTTEVGLARKLAYYSSLPVFVDDYRNDESGQRFHTFFRGVFNRTSPTKGLKEESGVRRVSMRGALLITGETCPVDPALLSRIVSVELTNKERDVKYFKALNAMEPQFASVGLDWLKHRHDGFAAFLEKYEQVEAVFTKAIESPRQAAVWAVPVAAALTEPFFAKQEQELLDFAIKIAKNEIQERKSDELMGMLWEAVDILHHRGKLDSQCVDYDLEHKAIAIHLPSLLGEIAGNPLTNRKYIFPNTREVAKILKQEPYILGMKKIRVGVKTSWRWVADVLEAPEVLQDIFEVAKDKEKEDTNDL